MSKHVISILPLAALCTLALGQAAQAQRGHLDYEDEDWCERAHYNNHRDRVVYCEVREETLAAGREMIAVDGSPNGGITITGWDRDEILVQARVTAHARSEDEAEDLATQVEIDYGNTIQADGPHRMRRSHWSVSYRIFAPRESNLRLETTNGGIHISEINGDIDFETTNGGVDLYALSGDVRGRTTNGGVHVELVGESWDGRGMDVRTTNGGIHITVPDGYSAHLETGTVNGGMRVDFPIIIQGRFGRTLSTDLGNGGQTIRATTTNGGVEIRRG